MKYLGPFKMLSNPFQTNYVLVEPPNVRFTPKREKSQERAYYLGAAYSYSRGCLAEASKKGYLGVVKYLVGCGANIHTDEDGALRSASGEGHLEVVKYLVSQGADTHSLHDDSLKCASMKGHLDVVKYLLSQGADVHAMSDSALICASAEW